MASPNATLNPMKTEIKLLQLDQLGKSSHSHFYLLFPISSYFGSGRNGFIHKSLNINSTLDNTTVLQGVVTRPEL